MKIIFLDIDGVLNSNTWLNSKERNLIPRLDENNNRNIHSWFDPNTIFLLNNLIEKTGAKIVISSTWRLNKTLEQLKCIFNQVGVEGEIIGMTPRLSVNYNNINILVPRGFEIKVWLENSDKTNIKCKINYVIIDDIDDILLEQKNNFVKVDFDVGLTLKNIEKSVMILNL